MKLFIKKRGFIMDLVKQLHIVRSHWKDEKIIKNSQLSKENDNGLAIYEDIEKIVNGKKQSSLDLDINLLLNRLV